MGLVEASLCSPADEEAHRQKVDAAAEHGEHRLRMGVPEDALITEYGLLRYVITRFVREHFPTPEAQKAILRLSTSTTIALAASLWGYHRNELEGRQEWPKALDQLADSWLARARQN